MKVQNTDHYLTYKNKCFKMHFARREEVWYI